VRASETLLAGYDPGTSQVRIVNQEPVVPEAQWHEWRRLEAVDVARARSTGHLHLAGGQPCSRTTPDGGHGEEPLAAGLPECNHASLAHNKQRVPAEASEH
jgi:hypothetical protein